MIEPNTTNAAPINPASPPLTPREQFFVDTIFRLRGELKRLHEENRIIEAIVKRERKCRRRA